MGARNKRPKGGLMGWLQQAVLGFVELCSTVAGLDGKPIIAEISIAVLFCIPVSVVCSYWVWEGNLHWDNTMHTQMAAALGFLLVFRLQTAYSRYWEVRRRLPPPPPFALARRQRTSARVLAPSPGRFDERSRPPRHPRCTLRGRGLARPSPCGA